MLFIKELKQKIEDWEYFNQRYHKDMGTFVTASAIRPRKDKVIANITVIYCDEDVKRSERFKNCEYFYECLGLKKEEIKI